MVLSYHPNIDFEAETINPHLWLDLALTDVQPEKYGHREDTLPISAYIVRTDGSVGRLSWDALNQADRFPQDSTEWANFCKAAQRPCGMNPHQHGRFACVCSYRERDVRVVHLVINYNGHDVAMSINPWNGVSFKRLVFSRVYHPPGRPGVLVSASNSFFAVSPRGRSPESSSRFSKDSEDGYVFYIGTLKDLDNYCLGIHICNAPGFAGLTSTNSGGRH